MLWKSNGTDYEQAPLGTHVARCVRLIDIGTQDNEYEGRKSTRRQVVVTWELPEELMSTGDFAGQPFLISKFFTQSLNEKATLRKWLITWRGGDFTPEELEGFDAKNILGAPCLLSVTASDTTGKSIASGVMKLTKGIKPPAQITPTVFFSLEPDEFDRDVFEGLSDGFKKMINLSPEWAALSAAPSAKPAPAQSDDPAEWPDDEEDCDDMPDF
jgi:hypothetical protein